MDSSRVASPQASRKGTARGSRPPGRSRRRPAAWGCLRLRGSVRAWRAVRTTPPRGSVPRRRRTPASGTWTRTSPPMPRGPRASPAAAPSRLLAPLAARRRLTREVKGVVVRVSWEGGEDLYGCRGGRRSRVVWGGRRKRLGRDDSGREGRRLGGQADGPCCALLASGGLRIRRVNRHTPCIFFPTEIGFRIN